MKIFLFSLFCLLAFPLNFDAQIADNINNFSNDYSESLPYTPTEFDDKKSKKNKKKKLVSDNQTGTAVLPENKFITIPLTVADRQNMIVQRLKREDFRLFIDQREITDFTLEEKSETLNIILLLDTSPSTA